MLRIMLTLCYTTLWLQALSTDAHHVSLFTSVKAALERYETADAQPLDKQIKLMQALFPSAMQKKSTITARTLIAQFRSSDHINYAAFSPAIQRALATDGLNTTTESATMSDAMVERFNNFEASYQPPQREQAASDRFANPTDFFTNPACASLDLFMAYVAEKNSSFLAVLFDEANTCLPRNSATTRDKLAQLAHNKAAIRGLLQRFNLTDKAANRIAQTIAQYQADYPQQRNAQVFINYIAQKYTQPSDVLTTLRSNTIQSVEAMVNSGGILNH